LNLTNKEIEFLKKTMPYIALPCYNGQICESFFVSILKTVSLFNQLGINLCVDTLTNESLIPRGRNSLVAKMMASKINPTHLIFIDVDISFDETSIIKLLLADKDIVGGLYPKKTLPISYVVNGMNEAKRENSLLQVRHIGTGFMCIKKQVIEKMFKKYKKLKYKTNIGLGEQYDEYTYALFDTCIDTETNDYLSEDYTFCKRWVDMGGEIWAETSIVLHHSGYYVFQGRGLTEEELRLSANRKA
jgi:hypothetical protein